MYEKINANGAEGFAKTSKWDIWLEALKKGFLKIKDSLIPFFEKFISNFKKASATNIFNEEIEFLTMERLIEIAQKHMVANSNEVAAFKEMKDEAFFIYLAYSKDRELIEEKDNHYVIIKSEGLSKDVKNLFNESDLIILK